MCLNKATRKLDPDTSWISPISPASLAGMVTGEHRGWKIFIQGGSESKLYAEYFGSLADSWPIGKWITALETEIHASDSSPYISGFHFFLPREDADTWLRVSENSSLWAFNSKAVCSVKVRGVHTEGIQVVIADHVYHSLPTFVAREMMIEPYIIVTESEQP